MLRPKLVFDSGWKQGKLSLLVNACRIYWQWSISSVSSWPWKQLCQLTLGSVCLNTEVRVLSRNFTTEMSEKLLEPHDLRWWVIKFTTILLF